MNDNKMQLINELGTEINNLKSLITELDHDIDKLKYGMHQISKEFNIEFEYQKDINIVINDLKRQWEFCTKQFDGIMNEIQEKQVLKDNVTRLIEIKRIAYLQLLDEKRIDEIIQSLKSNGYTVTKE